MNAFLKVRIFIFCLFVFDNGCSVTTAITSAFTWRMWPQTGKTYSSESPLYFLQDINILIQKNRVGFCSCDGQAGHVTIERVLNIDPCAKIKRGKIFHSRISIFIFKH